MLQHGAACVFARACAASAQLCGEQSRTTVLLRASLPELWKISSGQLPRHDLSAAVLSTLWEVSGPDRAGGMECVLVSAASVRSAVF